MELPSSFQINDECSFIPTFKQHSKMGIAAEPMEGKIIAIRFTEPKVFYDVLSEYYGKVFKNIPSEKVASTWIPFPKEEEPELLP